jgi:hypothetical protein
MAGRDWRIEGRYVEYCSCDLGCPCESMADPTYGICTGLVAFKIDKGHCEKLSLDGLAVVATFYFPRAIDHGQGVLQPIIDERANDAQRDALFYILSGEDQKAGTMFQIFSTIIETIKDPQFSNITFEWDQAKRTARIEVPGIVRATSEPIRNPVTNEEHRMLTVLPNGWVFHEAESAAGFAKGIGAKPRFSRRSADQECPSDHSVHEHPWRVRECGRAFAAQSPRYQASGHEVSRAV